MRYYLGAPPRKNLQDRPLRGVVALVIVDLEYVPGSTVVIIHHGIRHYPVRFIIPLPRDEYDNKK